MRVLSQLKSNFEQFWLGQALSSNFNDHTKFNLSMFSSLTEIKSYIPIVGCVFEHIITTNDLLNITKIYYLLIYSLALINLKKNNNRSFALSANAWAKMLNCSRSQVFSLQKLLEESGYLIIIKDKNNSGQNKRNLLIPTLPDSVFKSLSKSNNRVGEECLNYDNSHESKLDYLDRTKLFIPLNYSLLKIITSNEDLSPLQKVIWLDFYTKSYKSYMSSKSFGFSFISSYDDLIERYGCSRTSLSKVINSLETNGFITKTRFFCKKDRLIEDRQDKSLWNITLSIPNSYNLQLTDTKDRTSLSIEADNYQNYQEIDEVYINDAVDELSDEHTINNDIDSLINTDSTIINQQHTHDVVTQNLIDQPTKQSELEDDISCGDPHISKSSLYINKDFKEKIKDIKSNLGHKSKVLFNDFLKKFRKEEYAKTDKTDGRKKTVPEFNICSELIRQKLKELPKDKVDKARKFAYSLISKKLATGYAASLNKHELAKQLILHSATWKPTKLGSISKEKQIDVALSIAWKAVINGTWTAPLEYAKAEVLNYEYQHYRSKYQEYGILAHEVTSLESTVDNLLGVASNLKSKITEGKDPKAIANLRFNTSEDEDFSVDNADPRVLAVHGKRTQELGNNLAENIIKSPEDHKLEQYDIDTLDDIIPKQTIDVSYLTESQRAFKITGTDTDQMILENANRLSYYGSVEQMQLTDDNKMILVFSANSHQKFLDVQDSSISFINSE